jgi:hypothetical protein
MINFHRFLIGTAIVFCAGFSLWMLVSLDFDSGLGDLTLGLFFAAAAGALGYYLKNLRRFLGR